MGLRFVSRGLLAMTVLLSPLPAAAELGHDISTVRADVARMKGSLSVRQIGTVTRHDIIRSNGGTVHEFTNAAGQVFAVTWYGPGKPDLRALLGSHFDALKAPQDAHGRMMHGLRRPAVVNQADLKIQMTGHMGWFSGVAYIPSLKPADFPLEQLDPTR